jgi:hypothetical protein
MKPPATWKVLMPISTTPVTEGLTVKFVKKKSFFAFVEKKPWKEDGNMDSLSSLHQDLNPL